MPIDEDFKLFKAEKLDGGLVTRVPAHSLLSHQSPDAQNFDPSEVGAVKKRKGYAKFTGSAKGSPTGTFCSGLFAATSNGANAIKAWQVDISPSTFTDETTDFNSSAAGDVQPFPAAEAIGDYFAVGHRVPFRGLNIVISTAGIGGVIAWEYWNGSAWTALSSVSDLTVGFTATASSTAYSVYWTVPSDWATTSLNGTTLYYARARVTTTYSTNPVFTSGTLSGINLVLAAEGTTVQDISDGTWNTALTGATITVDTMVRMFLFNNVYIICNEGGGPYKWTGFTSVSALSGSPPSSARGGGVHRSRAWLYSDSSLLSYSALSDPEDWTTADNAGSITINKGDGYIINGFASGGDFALISKISPSSGGKEGALYALFGSSPFDFNVKRIASIGALGQEAMITYDNMTFIATNRGVFGVNGRNFARIDDPIQPTFDAIPNKGTIAMGREGKQIRISYPASGTANNREFVYDIERGTWGLNTGKTNRVYTNHPDGRLLMGTSGSSILVWADSTGSNDDGSNINFYWTTPEFCFSNPAYRRRLQAAHIQVSNSITTTLSLEHYINGTAQTWAQTMSTSTDFPVRRYVGTPKTGNLHQIKITNNTSDGQTKLFGIAAYAEEYQPGAP